MLIHITLPFIAPVTVGSEVTLFFCEEVKFFGGWEETDPILLDHKSGILYGHFWMPLETAPTDLIDGKLDASGYRLSKTKPPRKARVLRCTVRSKNIGESNDVGTFLMLEPIVDGKEPYRG